MSDTKPSSDKNGIQVIARAAAILRALKDNQTGMSLGEISSSVDLPRSTVQRIVNALQAERLIIANASGRGLRLGPEVSALAEAARYNIVETCRLFLMELTQDTGETADLSVMRGAGMIFLDQVPGTHRLRTVSSVGEVFPLTSTANGQACLSRLPVEKASGLIMAEWERRGVTGNLDSFLNKLAGIREKRLAYDLGEHTQGICAIGIAFEDMLGDVHAISVPVPSTRFEDVLDTVETALLKTARNIDKLMTQGN